MIRLLIVDDEKIIRDGIIAMLPFDALDLRLTNACANAFDALQSMADDMPDILITDIKMPQMDGLELIERALKLNPRIRCMVLSGYDEFAFAQRAMKMGVKEYLLKPHTRAALYQALDRMCNEINDERKRNSNVMGDRSRRVVDLACRLASLAAENKQRTDVTVDQVHSAVSSTGDEALLREAYTYILVHQDNFSAESLASIQQAYENVHDLELIIAKSLTRLSGTADKRPSFVKEMCSYIQSHYQDEELSLQYLADHIIHMRADYIGRIFTQNMGMKVSEYLLQVRMEKAKELIARAEDEPFVYEIAERVGLGHNPQYFSTLFRKYTGTTPKAFWRGN